MTVHRDTVLIVDDEEAILKNLKDFFGRDYNLLTARSAEEAKKIIENGNVQVVVSDYMMPGQDGLSFLIETKKIFPNTARVLMTAYADMNLVIRAMNEGEIHRFISKPYKSFEFRTILKDCLRLSKMMAKKESSSPKERLILIANDSQISLSTLSIILGSSYRLISTSSGLEVLSLVSGNPVEALVIGVGMEIMDGCTICSYLKKEKKVDFPVIFWNRDITGPFEEYLRECGADYWIDEENPSASRMLTDYLRENLS